LIRVFRAEVGLTPHAYVVDVRVRRAQALLKEGASPADAAARVGFADQAHLTRAFKARVGVAPGAYRRAHVA
jgi:AraC-like DNA-binding protein